MASVYHRIIRGRKNRVDTSSWLVFPRTSTSANKRVMRKKRTRESQPSQAATFCVISIRGELVGRSAVPCLKSQSDLTGRVQRAIRYEPPSPSFIHIL